MHRIILFLLILQCHFLMVHGQINSYSNMAKSMVTSYSTSSPRMQALGGVHGVLGADISAISGNPAGLGFYNRSEVSLGVSYLSASTEANYLGEKLTKSNSFVQIPVFGLVLGSSPQTRGSSPWHGSFGVGYSRQVVFAQPISISGTNNRSSLLDRFIERANDKGATGQSLDDEYNTRSNYADSPEAVAYQAFLINPDPKTDAAPFRRYEPNLPTKQIGDAENEGALSQWDISYGASYQDKFYIGLGLHFSKMNATATTYWQEQFVGSNYVAGFTYQERLVTVGSGIGATLGMIYKVNQSVRVSMAIQTPTFFDQMNEQYNASLTPRVFGIPSFDSKGNPIIITKVNPVKLTPNEFTYQLTTPMRLSGGIAYFLGKSGFISADLEYINYTGSSVSAAELSPDENLKFQTKYNGQTQKNFQSAIHLKVGTEIRVAPSFSVRGGLATWGNGYATSFDSIDRKAIQISGGIGYRSDQFYIDLTAYQRTQKDAYTPYSLKSSTDFSSANLSLTNTQFMVGVGIYF